MIKKIQYCKRLCAALLLVLSTASAQKVGTTSLQFLKVMPTARASAMGDAYVSLATGADAVFWNPGGLAWTETSELSITYIDWIFDTYQGALSYALPIVNWGVFGFQLQYVDYGTFEEAVGSGLTGRTFRPLSYVAGVSYAANLTDRFSTGVTVKYAYESLFDKDYTPVFIGVATEQVKTFAQVFLFDFGFTYHTGYRSVRIATSIQNFGSSVRFHRELSAAPLQFRLGISADLIGTNGLLADNEQNRVSAEYDLFQPNDYAQQSHIGIEYEFAKTFCLRVGYKFNYDFESFTGGAGVKQELSGTQLSFDYSYGSMGVYLGSVHRISIGAVLL